MRQRIKWAIVRIRNLFRPSSFFMRPFQRSVARLAGIRSTFLTHQADRVHGAMVRGDRRPDYMSEGELRLLLSLIEPGMNVLDIGANLGTVAVTLAKGEPTAHIFCFEPEPRNYGMLVVNLELNGLDNVTAMNFAVGSKTEVILMTVNRSNFGDHRTYQSAETSDARFRLSLQRTPIYKVNPVEVLRGRDDFGFPESFDLVKIDTQGSDFDVLRAVLPLLRRGARVAIEFSPFHLTSYGESWEDLESTLRSFQHIERVAPSSDAELTHPIRLRDLKLFFTENHAAYSGYMDLLLVR